MDGVIEKNIPIVQYSEEQLEDIKKRNEENEKHVMTTWEYIQLKILYNNIINSKEESYDR
jgi:hypothetical protein